MQMEHYGLTNPAHSQLERAIWDALVYTPFYDAFAGILYFLSIEPHILVRELIMQRGGRVGPFKTILQLFKNSRSA